MRVAVVGLLALGLATSGSVAQQPMSQNERAYTVTLVCVTIAANDRDDAGHQRSLDAARRMATVLGHDLDRLSHDLITMASVVGVQLREEPAKVAQSRAICRQLGLLS